MTENVGNCVCLIDKTRSAQLTCNGEWDHLTEDTSHTVLGNALVAPGVLAFHGLNLVEMLGRKSRDEISILDPAVLRLGEAECLALEDLRPPHSHDGA